MFCVLLCSIWNFKSVRLTAGCCAVMLPWTCGEASLQPWRLSVSPSGRKVQPQPGSALAKWIQWRWKPHGSLKSHIHRGRTTPRIETADAKNNVNLLTERPFMAVIVAVKIDQKKTGVYSVLWLEGGFNRYLEQKIEFTLAKAACTELITSNDLQLQKHSRKKICCTTCHKNG